MEGVVRTRPLRGLQTGWIENGEAGKPIFLLLHGYPDTPAVWDRQARHYADRFHVIRPFSRGVGPSAPARTLARYRRDATAFDWLQLLKAVDPEGTRPIVVAGHDLGAPQAAALAPYLGPRLKALILFNGITLKQMARRLRDPRQLVRSWYIYPFLVPGVSERLVRLFGSRILRAGRIGAVEPNPDPAETESRLVNPLMQYRAFATELPRAAFEKPPRLKCPTLVVWGVRDPFLIPPTRDEWDGFSTDVTIRLLKGGHWVYRDKAAVVNGLLDEFLAAKGVVHAD